MNTDFRNRVVLPILLPLGVLVGIVAVVLTLAFVLLYTPRNVGLMIAVVVAAGFMVAFSLANAVDEDAMTVGRRVVIGAVGILPVIAGGAAALWTVNGGIPEEDLKTTVPAYYEPKATAPEGAIIGALNSENFCTFEDPANPTAETCIDSQEATFPAQPDSPTFNFIFENYQSGVPHNVQLFELAGSADAPEPGTLIYGVEQGSQIINGEAGGAAITYGVDQSSAPLEEGAQLYYNCVVHPAMNGVLTIGPPPEAAG